MERTDWLAWRRKGIGASDIAGILGISPWASPWSVWADWILSTFDDVDEYGYDAFDNASRESESEVESMLEAWASRVTYRMAHTLVATHRLTLVDEQPFLDGEPLYVPSGVDTSDQGQVT